MDEIPPKPKRIRNPITPKPERPVSRRGLHLKKYHIKKGQVLNPEGARAHNPAMKELKALTVADMQLMGSMVVKGDLASLARIAADDTTPALQAWIAKIALTGIRDGDIYKLDALLNRLIGKVPDAIAMQITNPLSSMTEEDLKAKLNAIEAVCTKVIE